MVRQYLSHESELQQHLADMRERAARAAGEASVSSLDEFLAVEHRALDVLGARVEAYPDLEGIDLIAVFNRRLVTLENEIAMIRAGFNDAVETFETRRQRFPDNLLAKVTGDDVSDEAFPWYTCREIDVGMAPDFAYYLVYPQGSADDARVMALREWLARESCAKAAPPPP